MENLLFTIYQGKILSALCEERKFIEVSLEDRETFSILGNIYIGRVENVVKSINAAFVEISKGIKGYYSLEDNQHHLFLNRKNTDKVCIGDLLLVQVERDAVKTKAPILSSKLNLSGTYIALSNAMSGICISNKIKDKQMQAVLKEKLKDYATGEYGFIARTNCESLFELKDQRVVMTENGSAVLKKELEALTREYQTILELAPTRTALTLMRGSLPGFLERIKNVRMEQLQQITTDDMDLFHQIKDYLDPVLTDKLRFYQDPLLPLKKLYSIESQITDALRERVWLKCGGYLVLQPTEALTVIDVNTGKYIHKTGNEQREDEFYKVNCEAAVEIGRQLRLRNYSGIIIVDFIDMKKKEHQDALMKLLEEQVSRDPVPTTVMDITKLGLVELTRKKIKRPLYEQINCY